MAVQVDHHVIKKGLDLPISGAPATEVDASKKVSRVAIVADDYVGMRPTILAKEGTLVKRGQPVFENKKQPGVLHVAPGAGKVVAVNRGARRALQTVVIELSEEEQRGEVPEEQRQQFEHYSGKDIAQVTGDEARALLIESGLWTSLRTRPYSKQPSPEDKPHSIFVNAMDTSPLAPPMDAVLEGREADFETGLLAAAKLTDGRLFVCKSADSKFSVPTSAGPSVHTFEGPHPSGLVGLHIHLLDPVHRGKTVWHLGLQDVLTIGELFRTGKLEPTRLLSLAGPGVRHPRLIRTRMGACVDELTKGELMEGEMRVLSGSVLEGRSAMGEIHGFLGHYHNQISVVREGRAREFLGWLAPGFKKFSVTRAFVSAFTGNGQKYDFTTDTNGSPRAMVPIGLYEKVMPMDIIPTYLLRSLVVGDLERAEELGLLELDEEDLALCTFVCPGKTEYGPYLRQNLDTMEKEG